MALIVETGQGLSAADSYVSADDCLAYAGRMGLVFGDGIEAEAALRRATQWLDAAYADQWPGAPAHGREQALQWPRKHATDAHGDKLPSDSVPREVVSACCIAAIREFTNPESLSPDITPGKIMTSAAVTGAVSVTWAASGGVDGQRPVVTAINDIMAPILKKRSKTTGVTLVGRL